MSDYPADYVSVSAYFYAEPGSNQEKACRSIFDARGGLYVGAGSWMIGPSIGERDVQYMMPPRRVDETKVALKKAGFRIEPTPIPEELEGKT